MKKITVLILTLYVLMVIAGCGNDSAGNENNTGEAEPETTSVSVNETTKTAETTTIQTEQTTEGITGETETKENKTEENETEVKILEVNKKELYKSEWSEEYGVNLAKLDCSTVCLGTEDAKRYPELARVLSEASNIYETNMLEENNTFIESAKESLSTGTKGFNTLVNSLNVHVRRADNIALSILYDSYYYNGMNEGIRSFWGGNYDTKTGKEIYLPDVVTDIDKFAKIVETELFRTMGNDVFYNDKIIVEYFKEYGTDGNHWTLEYNGITVYFDEGEIANSGVGAISVTIEFSEHRDIFVEKYINVPETYIVGLPMKSTFITDLDNDGKSDELTLNDSYDEEFAWKATLYISTAEVDYVESFWAYGCETYYVKTADDRNYLYVFIELETHMELYVYKVTNETISKVGQKQVSPFYKDEILSVPTDPDSMHFDDNGKIELLYEDFCQGISAGNTMGVLLCKKVL